MKQAYELTERYHAVTAYDILERACLHLVQQFRLVCGTDAGFDNITARKYLIEAMVRVQVKP